MTRLFVSLLFLSMLIHTGQAQPKSPSADEKLEELRQELNLTEKQAGQISSILENEQKELENVRALNKEDRRAINDARKSLREQTDQQILRVLTDEQRVSYQKLQSAKPQNPRLRELQKQLDLSTAQVQQLDPILEKYQQQMQLLREESGEDRRKMRKEMRSIRESEKKEIRALLTDDQKKIYDELLKEQREQRTERSGKRGRGGRF